MKDQTPLATKPEIASEGLARKFGDWWRDLGLDHQAGGQELHQFMAHPDSANQAHMFINRMAAEYRNSLPLIERPPQFSLRLDIFTSKEEMVATTEGKGHIVSDYAKSVVKHKDFLLYTGTEIFDFIPGTVKEVTGKDLVKTPELYEAQARLGFIVAPHPSAFAIRSVYTDQPMDEWRSVLSEPVPDSDGGLSVLYVVRNSYGSCVYGCYANPDYEWNGAYRLWVCRKRLLVA